MRSKELIKQLEQNYQDIIYGKKIMYLTSFTINHVKISIEEKFYFGSDCYYVIFLNMNTLKVKVKVFDENRGTEYLYYSQKSRIHGKLINYIIKLLNFEKKNFDEKKDMEYFSFFYTIEDVDMVLKNIINKCYL